jgi:hypothetical protein
VSHRKGKPFPNFAPFTVGTGYHYMTAYSVDVAGNKSNLHAAFFAVQSPTSTKISSSANPVVYGNNVTLTASVAASFGPTPIGAVIFKNGTAILGTAPLKRGIASLVTSTALVEGSDSITAVYLGNSDDEASTSSPLILTVKQAGTSTALVSSGNPLRYGSSARSQLQSSRQPQEPRAVQLLSGTEALPWRRPR